MPDPLKPGTVVRDPEGVLWRVAYVDPRAPEYISLDRYFELGSPAVHEAWHPLIVPGRVLGDRSVRRRLVHRVGLRR